jgi:hypothetical protein
MFLLHKLSLKEKSRSITLKVMVLRTNPKYSVAQHEKRATIVGKEEYFKALRKAGLK